MRRVYTGKKSFLIITCIIFLFLFLSGSSLSEKTSEMVVLSSEDFLSDMAMGIHKRLAGADQDTSLMTVEEVGEYHGKLVSIELSYIEKYYDTLSDDPKLAALANNYIAACQVQLTAAHNVRKRDLYYALWEGGRTIRSGIIVYLYENYDLDLTPEEVSGYYPSNQTTFITSSSSDPLDYLFPSDNDDVVLFLGDLTIANISGKIENQVIGDNSYLKIVFTVRNNSAYTLKSIHVNYLILDKDGNILGSQFSAEYGTLNSGKTMNCNSTVNLTDYPGAKYIVIDHFSYDGDGDNVIHDLEATEQDIAKYVLEIQE